MPSYVVTWFDFNGRRIEIGQVEGDSETEAAQEVNAAEHHLAGTTYVVTPEDGSTAAEDIQVGRA